MQATATTTYSEFWNQKESGLSTQDRQLDYGPQRASWTVTIRPSTLRPAVNRKITFHKGRIAHWKRELKDAEAKMRKSVQIREHQVTGGVQHTTVVDQERANHVTTCRNKIDANEGLLEEYEAWRGLLANADDTHWVRCTVADARFFGLGDRE